MHGESVKQWTFRTDTDLDVCVGNIIENLCNKL